MEESEAVGPNRTKGGAQRKKINNERFKKRVILNLTLSVNPLDNAVQGILPRFQQVQQRLVLSQ